MTDARHEVLARIASALGRAPATGPADPLAVVAGIERRYRRPGDPTDAGADLVGRFAERAGDYKASVTVVAPADLPAAVASAAAGGAVLAAPGIDPDWLRGLPGAERDDPPRSPAELDGFDVAVTASALAVAETGTIVLDHRPDQGRRALTLVPDHHVCVVDAGRIVAGVPDAVAALDPRRPLTWISGPSATSDIELDRVEGVHGPRRLDILVVTPAAGGGGPGSDR